MSPSKVYTHDQLQRPKAHKMHAWNVRSSHFKQLPKDYNHGSSLPSASPRHFIIIKVQAYRVSSMLNGPRRSKWPNFASLHIWFATSWLSLKFVSLFHISMFLWILKIHVAFDVLCSCIYIYIFFKKIQKKKFQDFQIFLKKKREKFSNEKSIWTRGIEPLSHLKKKKKKQKILWTRGSGLPSDFFKKDPFFSYKNFKIIKGLIFKMVHEDLLDKTFSKSWCLKAWAINLYQGMINFI